MSKRKSVLVILILVLFVTGCRGTKEVYQTENDEDYPVVTMAYIGDKQKDIQLVEDAINQYMNADLGIQLKLVNVNLDGYQEEYRMQLARTDGIDIALMLLPDINDFISDGMLLELDDYLENHGKHLQEKTEEYGLDYAKIQNHIYGIPIQQEWNAQTYVLMRKDLLDKYQLDVSDIVTLEDCDRIFSVIKANEPQMQVICGTSGLGLMDKFVDWEDLTDSLGVIDLAENETKVVNLYETDVFLNNVQILYDFYKKGYITDAVTMASDSEQEQMRSGQVFSYIASGGHVLSVEHSNRSGYELVAVPVGSCENYAMNNNAMFSLWIVSKMTKTPELAVEALDYIYGSTEICNLLNWGVEGVHYEIADEANGIIHYPDGIDFETAGYHLNTAWMFPNAFSIYRWEGSGQPSKKEAEEKNRGLQKTKVFGFLYDDSSVKQQVDACQEIVSYYKGTLYYGLVDPKETLAKMNQELYEAGLQDIIDEKQHQLDYWLEKQE